MGWVYDKKDHAGWEKKKWNVIKGIFGNLWPHYAAYETCASFYNQTNRLVFKDHALAHSNEAAGAAPMTPAAVPLPRPMSPASGSRDTSGGPLPIWSTIMARILSQQGRI